LETFEKAYDKVELDCLFETPRSGFDQI